MLVLAVLFPLVGLALNLALRPREPTAGIVASAAAGASFIASLALGAALVIDPTPATVILAPWLNVGALTVHWGLQADTLTVTMMLVVTGLGTLIHIYSIGYMHGDARFTRFFIYLNLFLAAMLILVTADNYLMLFAGWEGVGLCSFLLIGFWFDKAGEGERISNAARKAFIVNRIGDAGLLIGLLLIAVSFGSLDFTSVFTSAKTGFAIGAPLMTAITLLLFVGVTGKSAQIPLYVWLPDAMAGPTPVSALIHAATMVTAGVYLIVRSHVLFDLAPLTQSVVAGVGAVTALFAATIAVSQFDIKRALAFSTISQLGFMVAAVGMGAYTAGMFHLITHAFFKALLFLTAGALLHTLGTQDSRLMGGLRGRLKTTFAVYVIGALALSGLPPFSGFFSKDEILATAFEHNLLLYLVLAAASFLTAFYIVRQIMLIFAGAPRSEAAREAHHEARLLIVPLILLAALAAFGGVLNVPGVSTLDGWLAHSLGESEVGASFNGAIAAISTLIALAGMGLAYRLYRRYRAEDPLTGWLFAGSSNGWWVDAFYDRWIVGAYRRLTQGASAFDTVVFYGIDRAFMLVTRMMMHWTQTAEDQVFEGVDRTAVAAADAGARRARLTQTGQLNWNIAGILGGLIVVLLIVIVGRGV